ncbi:MAG: hypothetical protein ACI905_001792 [Roseivirga sp.]|jgi:hypothetical protein
MERDHLINFPFYDYCFTDCLKTILNSTVLLSAIDFIIPKPHAGNLFKAIPLLTKYYFTVLALLLDTLGCLSVLAVLSVYLPILN